MTLRDFFDRPDWFEDAACIGEDPDLWFPGQGDGARQAKAICCRCPVRAECLTYGIGERFGVWGGLTEKERRRLRREHTKRPVSCTGRKTGDGQAGQ